MTMTTQEATEQEWQRIILLHPEIIDPHYKDEE